jgi:glycosyltransferase involved in cell wall biosynthesis
MHSEKSPLTQPRVLLMCAVDFTAWHFLRPLAKRLIAEGFDVTLACGGGRYAEKLQREGLRWIENPIARSMNPLPHFMETARTYQLIRKGGYDVVHVHTPIAALVGRIAAWLARVPVKIYTAHGFYFHERMPRMKRAFHIGLEKMGARFGDFIMTVSREDEEAAIQLGITRPEQVETIYNGVDVQYFSPGAIDSHVPNEVRRQLNLDESDILMPGSSLLETHSKAITMQVKKHFLKRHAAWAFWTRLPLLGWLMTPVPTSQRWMASAYLRIARACQFHS